MELIDALAQAADMPLHVQTDRVIKTPACTVYRTEKGEKVFIENLEELVTATRQFSWLKDEDLMPRRHSSPALEAGETRRTWRDAVR